MRKSILDKNGISGEAVELLKRLVGKVPWPESRIAMADVAATLLESRTRTAEEVFGWGREVVKLGLEESRSGMRCQNDLSRRRKPRSEEKQPKLLADIQAIMEPQSQAESHLRNTLLYANLSARTVRARLLKRGWKSKELPTRRTISNILNRLNYRLRTVEKAKVKKKPLGRTPSSKTPGA